MGSALQKEIEKHFTRQELRRSAYNEVGSIGYPARVRESYAQDLLETIDREAIARRGFRIVVDYGFSAAAYVLPLVLSPLAIEDVSAHAFTAERDGATAPPADSLAQARRLVGAVGADFGAVLDRAAERLALVDERGREVPPEQALLLFVRLLVDRGRTGKVAVPVTVTSVVDRLVEGSGLEVVRMPASLASLTRAATQEGVIFAGAVGGGFVFPEFLPAYDAVASLCNLLELLAPDERPLSELVAELPQPALVRRDVACPWPQKGLVMRVLNERFAGRDVDLSDGIKVFEERGWAQVLPDPDEPLLHLYAEGEDEETSQELADELEELVGEILQGETAAARS
jgi:mannose-1-phosphate guanylyltransferase / phosphomannomutase